MRNRLLALCVAFVLIGGIASAQDQVTALLKSGERVTGELRDLGGYDYTFMVNGQERRLPIGEVVVLDFSGNAQNLPAAEASRAGEGRHLIVLRNGQILEGKLLDIREGSRPLGLTVVVNGEQRPMSGAEVARVYIDRPTTGVATSGSASPSTGTGTTGTGNTRTVQVSARERWTPTGIIVRQGDMVQFSSSGEVQIGPNQDDRSTVNGIAGRQPIRGTLPETLVGALLGRVGNGRPFGLGGQASVPMPNSGELFLGVNDDEFENNSGEFTVTVTAPRVNSPVRRRR